MQANIINALRKNKFFNFEQIKGSVYEFNWHYHPEFEIILPINARGNAIVGNYIGRFHPGTMFMVGPNLPHVFYTFKTNKEKLHKSYIIRFSSEYIKRLISLFSELRILDDLIKKAAPGILFSERISCKIKRKMETLIIADEFRAIITFLEILEILAKSKEYQILSNSPFAMIDNYSTQRIRKINEYIHHNYTSSIRLNDIATYSATSVSNLCVCFKRAMGMSVITYVNELRISHACSLLRESDKSVLEVAQASGYSNLSHFNRTFLRVKNITPHQYRNFF